MIDFVRVLNNTTGSHLMGSKNPYGPVEIFKIEVVDIVEVLESKNFDIIKMDVEGHEAELITHLPPKFFDFVDFVLEIGSEINALRIFDFLKNHKIPIYTQKNGWKIASTWREIPIHHSEGSAFISKTKKPFL